MIEVCTGLNFTAQPGLAQSVEFSAQPSPFISCEKCYVQPGAARWCLGLVKPGKARWCLGLVSPARPADVWTWPSPARPVDVWAWLARQSPLMSGLGQSGKARWCLGLVSPARPADVWTWLARQGPLMSGLGPARHGPLLPAGGFTILRLVHIPSTPNSQVTIDHQSGDSGWLTYVYGPISIIAIKCHYVPPVFVLWYINWWLIADHQHIYHQHVIPSTCRWREKLRADAAHVHVCLGPWPQIADSSRRADDAAQPAPGIYTQIATAHCLSSQQAGRDGVKGSFK